MQYNCVNKLKFVAVEATAFPTCSCVFMTLVRMLFSIVSVDLDVEVDECFLQFGFRKVFETARWASTEFRFFLYKGSLACDLVAMVSYLQKNKNKN